MSASEKADVDYLTGMFDGFRATMVINAAVELGLFDLLERSGDAGVTATQLAQDQSWDAECTERMLDVCVSLKLLQKLGNVYQNTGPGRCLIKSADYSISGIVGMMKRLYDPLSKLSEEVKTGSHKSSGLPHHVTVHKPGSHQHGCQGHHGGHHGNGQVPSEEALLSRYRSMDGVCRPYANDLVKAFDLGQHKTAVDLGAGSGVLSYELARTYPSMHVTLFEVPNVIDLVEKYFVPKTEQLDVALMAGDFNEVDLPRADLYLLAKIVHDWNPQQITSLLSRVYASLNDGGAIVLLEKCLNDNKDGPAMAHLWDITVMSCCAGRLRSGAEYTALLEGIGFKDVKIHKSNVECSVDVIMATK